MFGMFRTFDRIALAAVTAAAAALLPATPGSAQTGPAQPGSPVPVISAPALPGAVAAEEPGVELGRTQDAKPAASVAAAGEAFAAHPAVLPEGGRASRYSLERAKASASRFLRDGGPALWAIAALSVATLALIFWKTWRLALIGAWSRGRAGRAVDAWERGEIPAAQAIVSNRRGLRAKVVATALRARLALPDQAAREDTARVAKRELAEAASGLRALELIATIAPLLGLLGTVMGMIAAFQALQQSGSRADPAMLAGGIWEALLTTAAGMAVAIPASAALTWFEAVIDRMRRDVEDAAARIFVTQLDVPQHPVRAAE
jgi:biopolymer transport protein ExbB